MRIGGGDAGAAFCIQPAQAADPLTVDATAYCGDLGMRLCHDGEWLQACSTGNAALTGMTDDWEWVVELYSETEAYKRGGGACDATSWHTIDTDAYAFRCCLTR
jgi:hypothetical protein